MSNTAKPLGAKAWMQIRTAYVVRGWSSDQCAKEFGCHPTTIRNRAGKEGWTQERDRIATDATAAATVELTSAARAAIDHLREQHATLVERMHRDILDGIAEDLAKIAPGRSRIEARKAAAEAYERVLKSSRLVLGITEGTSSLADAADTGARKIEFEEVAAEESA